MDFGKVKNIDNVDFNLPPDATGTAAILENRTRVAEPNIYIGCPVWANKPWVGTLYPPKTPDNKFLYHYTRQFNTIELNVTHYRIPDAKMRSTWQENSAEGFTFCPKVLQEISHRLLPAGNAQALAEEFFEAIAALSPYLGTAFLQLPPYFTVHKLNFLQEFLDYVPADVPLAVEFRHPNWFHQNNFEKAAEVLERYKRATVITDVAGRRDVLHMRLTTPEAVIRFVGNGLHDSDYTRIDAWVERLRNWLNSGLETVYFFVHEPDNVSAPELSQYLIEQLNGRCELQLDAPVFHNIDAEQGELF
ncbi:MAG: DUF72 domain-containing protein [Pseudomonadota bacterium]